MCTAISSRLEQLQNSADGDLPHHHHGWLTQLVASHGWLTHLVAVFKGLYIAVELQGCHCCIGV
jgi:hypothetical protein